MLTTRLDNTCVRCLRRKTNAWWLFGTKDNIYDVLRRSIEGWVCVCVCLCSSSKRIITTGEFTCIHTYIVKMSTVSIESSSIILPTFLYVWHYHVVFKRDRRHTPHYQLNRRTTRTRGVHFDKGFMTRTRKLYGLPSALLVYSPSCDRAYTQSIISWIPTFNDIARAYLKRIHQVCIYMRLVSLGLLVRWLMVWFGFVGAYIWPFSFPMMIFTLHPPLPTSLFVKRGGGEVDTEPLKRYSQPTLCMKFIYNKIFGYNFVPKPASDTTLLCTCMMWGSGRGGVEGVAKEWWNPSTPPPPPPHPLNTA